MNNTTNLLLFTFQVNMKMILRRLQRQLAQQVIRMSVSWILIHPCQVNKSTGSHPWVIDEPSKLCQRLIGCPTSATRSGTQKWIWIYFYRHNHDIQPSLQWYGQKDQWNSVPQGYFGWLLSGRGECIGIQKINLPPTPTWIINKRNPQIHNL